MRKYRDIHRAQLFHWIGSHIEKGTKRLTDGQRGAYLDALRGVLAARGGLWVKRPRQPDALKPGRLEVTRPIVCFTEWSLGESLAHTAKYGRLGLGFPKRFVLEHGGHPVTYVRGTSPYARALLTLDDHLGDDADEDVRDALDYVAHFAKRINAKRGTLAPVRARAAAKAAKPVRRRPPAPPDPFARRFGDTLHYLEEREWRIVYRGASADRFLAGNPNGLPDHYLPFKPGHELFTVVFPDNATVALALEDSTLRRRLLPSAAPHVTLLSLEDIGTF